MGKRDNEYWAGRLEKDGHGEILARVQSGEIKMYRARQLAGYLAEKPKSEAARLSFHWKRASAEERKRFVKHHLIEVNRVGREVLAEVRAQESKKALI